MKVFSLPTDPVSTQPALDTISKNPTVSMDEATFSRRCLSTFESFAPHGGALAVTVYVQTPANAAVASSSTIADTRIVSLTAR